MAYSSIKRTPLKKKKCKCGNPKCYPSLGFAGWNFKCAPEGVKVKAGSKTKLANKKKNARLSASLKIRKDAAIENKTSELELWFLLGMNTSMPICENCGTSKPDLLNPLLKTRWRSCQAHLLPKRHFKSICAHPLNRMILGSGFSGMCYCHDTYDHDWESASEMSIWPEVIKRFQIIYPLIDQKEYQFIPDVLLQYIPNI